MPEFEDITSYRFFRDLIAFPFVDQILLYGSRARRDHDERADIDLAIVCPKATEQDWNTTLIVIDKADTLLEIDCVRFDTIQNERFKHAILRNHIVLFDREKAK